MEKELMKTFTDSLAALKGKQAVPPKELAALFDLADKLGLGFEMKISSEKFGEIALDVKMTAADHKFTVGSATLTIRALH